MAYTPLELDLAQRDPHRALADNIGRGAALPPAAARADVAAVQPHAEGAADAALGAQAYARGADLHLGGGRPEVMAHEAVHVVQQRAVGGFDRP